MRVPKIFICVSVNILENIKKIFNKIQLLCEVLMDYTKVLNSGSHFCIEQIDS